MSRIISIIKDRHLGDFEYNLGRKTVRCLRACDYRVFIENDYEHLMVNIDLENTSKLIERACFIASALTLQGIVRCKYEYWRGELIIIIEDTGVGIESERLSTIFNHFDRYAKLSEYSTGLDLPIIQALAQMMGGDIEAQSGKDKGTTARITIPCEATLMEKKRKEQ